MAYAILKTGGKQYRVRPGDVIDVDKLPVEPGSSIELGDILAVSKDDGIVLGSPVVANASVLANVQDQIRDDKIIVFKYKRKVRYRVKRGHRQPYTRIAITAIMLDGEDVGSQAPVDVIAPEDVELEQPVDEADAVEDTVDESEEPDAEGEAAEDESSEEQDVEEDAGEASDEADGEEESGNGS
jgi:large subunit ribosomal protein L21